MVTAIKMHQIELTKQGALWRSSHNMWQAQQKVLYVDLWKLWGFAISKRVSNKLSSDTKLSKMKLLFLKNKTATFDK